MSTDDKSNVIRVGVFLAVGIGIVVFAVLMLGEKRGFFDSKTRLYVNFDNINGLVPSAPVRLAGLDVGTVEKIEFEEDLNKREARVELAIKDEFMGRIRADSMAIIDSKGLLGDKIVNVSIGSQAQPQLQEGDTLKARQSVSIEAIAAKAEAAITSISEATESAKLILGEIASEQTRQDLRRIVHSTAAVMEQVEKGDGLAHRLFYDDEYADKVAGILDETQLTLTHIRGTVAHMESIASSVRNGDGTLHDLVYEKTGAQALAEMRAASAELAALLHAVREEPGFLHSLIYDEDNGELMKQWTEISERMNRITAEMEKGRGTIGGLLVDPSVYEDMKTILGNVERNVLLKALIRYTIKEGDIVRPASMAAPVTAADSVAPVTTAPQP